MATLEKGKPAVPDHWLLKLGAFTVSFLVLYTVTVLVLETLEFRGKTLFCRVTGYHVKPGIGGSYTLQRFREITAYDDLDILFVGSSHCYRSFDPRLFAQAGLKTFNIGSTGQTPLNSYYLLRKYLSEVNPGLVVFEVFPHILQNDGFKSFVDVARNTPLSGEVVAMGLRTGNPHALNVCAAVYLRRLLKPLEQERQHPEKDEHYVEGGYVERNQTGNDGDRYRGSLSVNPQQMRYLKKAIELVTSRNSRILLVTQPLPLSTRNGTANYAAVNEQVRQLAGKCGVPYIDFNDRLVLDDRLHFFDWHHLNAEGVRLFNRQVLELVELRHSLAANSTGSIMSQVRHGVHLGKSASPGIGGKP